MSPTLPWMILNCSTPNHSPAAGKLLFLLALYELRMWSCSSSVLERRETHAGVSSRVSRGFLHSVYCMKASSSLLAAYGGTMRNRSSTFATHHLQGTWEVAHCRGKLFFNNFLASNLTVPEIRWSHFGYVGGSTMQLLSRTWYSILADRRRGIHSGVARLQWISCRLCEQGCRTTSSKRMTSIHLVYVSSN